MTLIVIILVFSTYAHIILYYIHIGRSGLIKLQWRTTSAALVGSGLGAVFTIRDTKALTTITRCSPRASDLVVKSGNAVAAVFPGPYIRQQVCPVAAADTRVRPRRTCNDTTLLRS